jgi:hypothetical protein
VASIRYSRSFMDSPNSKLILLQIAYISNADLHQGLFLWNQDIFHVRAGLCRSP